MRRGARRGRTYRASTSWSSRRLGSLNRTGSTRALTGFPDKMTVSLPYIINGRVNPGIVAGNDQVIRLNGAWDPDFSGVGHQPRGWDQWAAIYGKYRVSRVDLNILCRQRASHGINVRALANNSPATLAGDANVGEFLNHVYLGQTASNTPPVQRKLVFYPHKVLGLTWAQYIANDFSGADTTTTPVDEAYLHLLVMQVDNTTACDFEYEIQATYRVTFYERQNLPLS